MTPAEVHAFGIEVILPYLKKEGLSVEAVNADPSKQPQVVGRRWGSLAFVFVRTAMFPAKGELTTAEVQHALSWSQQQRATPFFASVGLACCAYPDRAQVQAESDMGLPIRNGGFHVAYEGLLLITTSDHVHAWPLAPR